MNFSFTVEKNTNRQNASKNLKKTKHTGNKTKTKF